jgi:hypothetical protein
MRAFLADAPLHNTSVMVCATIFALWLVMTPAARADVTVFDNLNTPTPNSFLDIKASQWDAQSFTVGSVSVPLSEVLLNLNSPTGTGGNFFVRLYGNGGSNVPGTVLQTLTGTSNPATSGIYSFSGSSLLSANTTYWVVAGVTSGSGQYEWNYELPASVESGSTLGWTYSTDQGADWVGLFEPLLVFNMRVTGVPEPSGLVLAALGAGLGFGGYRLRKRRGMMEWMLDSA